MWRETRGGTNRRGSVRADSRSNEKASSDDILLSENVYSVTCWGNAWQSVRCVRETCA